MLDLVVYTCNPSPQGLRQEDCDLGASLDYKMGFSQPRLHTKVLSQKTKQTSKQATQTISHLDYKDLGESPIM